MPLRIDHVTVAGHDLDTLRKRFDAVGLPSAYGGTHANGVTHMATLGLADGAYIELISTLKPDQPSPWWEPFIHGDAGPCGWCIEVDDVAATVDQARAAGTPVRGPIEMGRARPDGRQVEWDLAFLGEGEPGTHLPFVIRDRTPRALRIEPNPVYDAMGLCGVARVIAATPSIKDTAARYAAVFGLETNATRRTDEAHQLAFAHLADTPLTLVEPMGPAAAPIAQGLAAFGPSPVAFLLSAHDFPRACEQLHAAAPIDYLGMTVAWLIDGQLGVTPV